MKTYLVRFKFSNSSSTNIACRLIGDLDKVIEFVDDISVPFLEQAGYKIEEVIYNTCKNNSDNDKHQFKIQTHNVQISI
jgi:hypothetical protein